MLDFPINLIPDLNSFQKRPFPSGELELEGDDLSFPQAGRHHSGVYICSADNGFSGVPVTTMVKLDVMRE